MSHKGSRFRNFEILTSWPVFSPQKTYPYQFLDQNNHFIDFYWVFGEFWAILGKIGGQWRHKRGQDLKISKFWHHHRFSLPKKHTHTNFLIKTINLSIFFDFFVNFWPFWVKLGAMTSQKGSRFRNLEIMTSP